MKSLKIFVIVGLSLLFGGTCFAQQQEEFQKDSVWGLEWNLQDSILTVSFMSSCDGFISIRFMSFKNGVYDLYQHREAGYLFNYGDDGIEMSSYPNDNLLLFNQYMHMVSYAIDTISVELTRYTISVSLAPVYLTIPQDISTYCGYFGIVFNAKNHKDGVYEPLDDLTKSSQFLYFNLIDALSWNVDNLNDDKFFRESYYSMMGVPLREMQINDPVVVVRSIDNQIISSKVCVWRP